MTSSASTDGVDSLKRQLGLFPVSNLVIANMIGAGIFTTSGLLMGDLGNPIILILLWIIGGAIALCGALSYGELGAAIPRAGGEYAFLSELYHPVFGFLSGWVSFFAGFTAPIGASAIGFSEYLARAFPFLVNPGGDFSAFESLLMKKFFAVLVIVVFTFIHMRGLEIGVKIQNGLTILKVALMVGLMAAAFWVGKGDFNHFVQGGDFVFDFGGWKRMGLSLMWIMFAYSGWNASAYMGSEIKDPVKNLPRSLFLGTGLVLILYVGMNLFYVYGVAPAEMEGVVAIGGLAAANLFGKSFESVLSVFISFALFSSLSAYIILGPRVYYSMAVDGYFFKFASRVHPRYGVPSMSILLQGVIAAVLVIFGTFDQILTYMGFSLGIFPILSVVGVFKLRRLKLETYRMPGYPLVPIIYIISGVVILTLAYFQRPLESSVAMGIMLMGIPVFFTFRKRIKRKKGKKG